MKKTFRIIGMTLVAIMMAVNFSACGNDDDDDEPADPATHDSELIGTWEYHDEGSDWWETGEMTFYASGYYKIQETYWDEEDGKEKYWGTGTWETRNGVLSIYIDDSSDEGEIGDSNTARYYVNGNQLIFDGTTFTRKR